MTTADVARAGTGAPNRVRRPVVAGAAVLLGLLVLVALFPWLFTRTGPNIVNLAEVLRPPSWRHWFGTDQLGRDVLARVLHGTRSALLVGALATGLAVVAGSVVGLLAGLGGKAVDQVLMRAADILLALPSLLLALLVIAVLGPGTINVAVSVAVAFVPLYARLVRAEAMVVRRSGYVEAATIQGLPRLVVVRRHVLPNAVGPLVVFATVGFGTSLLYSSALSFFGLGVQPPTADWGAMLSDGKDVLAVAWWVGVFPGAAVTLTVISVNVVGRHLRSRLAGTADL